MSQTATIMKRLCYLALAVLLPAACEDNQEKADAYGNFEATEVIVSAETTGKLIRFEVEEGRRLEAGEVVGLIDTTQLHLRREQLKAGIAAISGKTQDPEPKIEVLREQLANLTREKERFTALLADGAATPKQVDDLKGQIDVIEKEIAATRRTIQDANAGILGEIPPLRAQIRQIEDQIDKSYLINPIDGVVLVKLAEPSEFTAAGKPLYKIADLDNMTLRAFVSGEQLPHIRIGQEVTVMIDEDATSNRRLTGEVSWISDQAEFTPKIVQTKEERVNLVYAVKVAVKNDGSLKIGMPGEIWLPDRDAAPEAESRKN